MSCEEDGLGCFDDGEDVRSTAAATHESSVTAWRATRSGQTLNRRSTTVLSKLTHTGQHCTVEAGFKESCYPCIPCKCEYQTWQVEGNADFKTNTDLQLENRREAQPRISCNYIGGQRLKLSLYSSTDPSSTTLAVNHRTYFRHIPTPHSQGCYKELEGFFDHFGFGEDLSGRLVP